MRITNVIISIFFLLFFNTLNAQIKIQDVGDGWKSKVDSAIILIKETDTSAYNILIENCKEIEFIIGSYSTTKPPYIIAITTKDMSINSINNIAAILVHESYHLYIYNKGLVYTANKEELVCYMREYDFLCKLPYVEDWLFKNVINKLMYYRNKSNLE